jgi:hypothetical protein
MTEDQIVQLFTYHAPDEKKRQAHEQINEKMMELALFFHRLTPSTAEETIAIRSMADTRMKMNQAVAMHGVKDVE